MKRNIHQLIWGVLIGGGLTIACSSSATASPDTGGFTVDPSSRQLTRVFFNTVYHGSANVDPSWTGSIGGCDPGTTDPALRDRVLTRLNFYRAMAGVPASVTLDSGKNADAQEAALMMHARNNLSHYPGTGWDCHTPGGADAAAKANLSIGNFGANAIYGQMQDSGSGNSAVGHRRWILYPPLATVGTGDVPGAGSGNRATNVLHILPESALPQPSIRDGYVAWPPPGHVPWPLVYPRWSFSVPGADFSGASISMTRNGSNLGVNKASVQNGYGENTLVWVPSGANANNGSTFEPDDAEDVYTVSISGVEVDGQTESYIYEVRVFDPADSAAGEDLPVVSGVSSLDPGDTGMFHINPVGFAAGYDREICRAENSDWFLGAENGVAGVIDETSASYPLVEGGAPASGDFSYHLATPLDSIDRRSFDRFTLADTFIPEIGGVLTFDSRMRNSTGDQVLRVEISGDGGLGWKTVFKQTGTNNSYTNRQISLAPWAGKKIRIRFRYGISEELLYYSYYAGTGPGTGFLVDNISLTGVSRLVDCNTLDIGSSTSFDFGTSTQGTYFLSARARIWGGYPGFDDAVAHRLDIIDTTDTDDDGVIDFFDNCPLIENFGQADFDGDGAGDACDGDDDGDGVDDGQDDFPFNAAASTDSDQDGMPDAFHESCGNTCRAASGLLEDGDDDNDGIGDHQDNCPSVANPDQANDDSDPLGNACDADSDNDGVDDGSDIDPLNPRVCGDSDGDTCDDCAVGRDRAWPASDFRPELDGDDLDADGICDAGDTDIDGDGLVNGADLCPLYHEPSNPSVCVEPETEFCTLLGTGLRALTVCL